MICFPKTIIIICRIDTSFICPDLVDNEAVSYAQYGDLFPCNNINDLIYGAYDENGCQIGCYCVTTDEVTTSTSTLPPDGTTPTDPPTTTTLAPVSIKLDI